LGAEPKATSDGLDVALHAKGVKMSSLVTTCGRKRARRPRLLHTALSEGTQALTCPRHCVWGGVSRREGGMGGTQGERKFRPRKSRERRHLPRAQPRPKKCQTLFILERSTFWFLKCFFRFRTQTTGLVPLVSNRVSSRNDSGPGGGDGSGPTQNERWRKKTGDSLLP
jgi:hypothetical protein